MIATVAANGQAGNEARFGTSRPAANESSLPIAEGRFVVSRWTMADGLPQSSPNALAFGPDGYLWVGTEQGLARFDGVDFDVWDTRHGLPGERVTELLATNAGVWTATVPGGLSRFDGETFEPVLPAVSVLSLLKDEAGTVWVGGHEGLFRIESGREARRVSLPAGTGRAFALLEDDEGGVLVGHEQGLSHLSSDGTWAERPLEGPTPPITGLAGSSDAVWIAARNGFWRLTDGSWQQISDSMEGRPRVVVDPVGDGWLWSANHGVRRYHAGAVQRVEALLGTDVLAFSVLPNGPRTVWLGIGGEGLLRLRRPLARAMTVNDGLPARAIHGVLTDRQGALWLGSLGSGLARVDGSGLRTYDRADGLPSAAVMSLAEDLSGRLFVGTTRGLAMLIGNSFRPVDTSGHEGLDRASVSTIYPDADGSLLFAAQRAVFRYTNGRVEKVAVLPFKDVGVEMLHRDRQGDLWIGGDGVCRLDSGELTCFSEADGLPPHVVRNAFETPAGGLWLGTYGGGLCRLEDGPSFRCLLERQGLPHRTVHGIVLDELGWIWLPSNRGLGRVRLAELERAFEDPSYVVSADLFDEQDGLPASEMNGGVPPTTARLADGRLAFPSMGGLAVIDPTEAASVTANSPAVHVETIIADGQELRPTIGATGLDPGTDRVTFGYTAIHPQSRSIRFRYLLQGRDDSWQAAGTERSVSYTGLRPGEYLFRLQARVGGSPWSDEASTAVTLPPFFWQTPWFILAVSGALVSLLWALYKLRVRRFGELARMRLEIASDLHDELSGELSAIALSSAIARRRDYLEEPERHRLQEIESTAREVITGLRDLVWAINPEHDTLGATVSQMRSAVSQLLDGLDWSFEEDWTAVEEELSMTKRRDLYLILKEAVTNVQRHARAEHVAVRLERSPDRLFLTVGDDGTGFDAAKVAAGNGLASMRRRANQMGAELVVESSAGRGTNVRLDLPVARLQTGRENSRWWRPRRGP